MLHPIQIKRQIATLRLVPDKTVVDRFSLLDRKKKIC